MAFQFASSNRRKARRYTQQKPRGVIHPRVQAVGPERFGILCVDCAKARSKIMLADFYRRVLIEPTTVTRRNSSCPTPVAHQSRIVNPSCAKWPSCVKTSLMPSCRIAAIEMQSVRLYSLSGRALYKDNPSRKVW